MPEFADLNYYEILDVDRHASADVIRLSYRRLMQRDGYHPDRGGDAALAALINKAYAVLCDDEKRMEYDARLDVLAQIAESGAHVAPHAATPPRRILDPTRECVFCESAHDLGTPADPDASCEACGSPLCIAENVRLETGDQRAVHRIAKALGVTYFTDWRQKHGFSARTEDISLNGLRLVTKRGMEPGQQIRVVSSVVDAVGRVSNCAIRRAGWKTEHVAGVSFLTLRLVRSVGGFVSRRV